MSARAADAIYRDWPVAEQQVLPIYPDTPDAPLVEAKDVKTEVMRSRGAGGQVSDFICCTRIILTGSTSTRPSQRSA